MAVHCCVTSATHSWRQAMYSVTSVTHRRMLGHALLCHECNTLMDAWPCIVSRVQCIVVSRVQHIDGCMAMYCVTSATHRRMLGHALYHECNPFMEAWPGIVSRVQPIDGSLCHESNPLMDAWSCIVPQVQPSTRCNGCNDSGEGHYRMQNTLLKR
jgi:aspartyl/asparaginyl beta-hydroxylase (cupin superfamily)